MLREAFTERLKTAMRAKDSRTVSTVRLMLAALKDRDIAARGGGNQEGIPEEEIRYRKLLAAADGRRRDCRRGQGGDRRDRRRRNQGYGQGHGRAARAPCRGYRHGPRPRGGG